VGSDGTILRWSGSGWAPQDGQTGNYLAGVSCSTETHCVAVGDWATVRLWDGVTWQRQAAASAPQYRSAVHCLNPALCVSIGGFSIQTTDGWSSVVSHGTGTGDPAAGESVGVGPLQRGSGVGVGERGGDRGKPRVGVDQLECGGGRKGARRC
jgi:hypothetical protein